jgi:AraC-like DNA-binding protein
MRLISGYSETSNPTFRSRSVESVWSYLAQDSHEHRVLPDGRCDVILRFNTDGLKPVGEIKALIAGPATTFHLVPMVKGIGYVGIRIRPAFARHVLGFELSMIANRVLAGEATIKAMPSLKVMCRPIESIERLVKKLELFVESLNNCGNEANRAVALINALHLSGGRLSVKELARLNDVDERTVRREFKKSTGLTPKQYAIIIQFHRALRLLRDVGLDAISTATEAGYADQAHMTRMFRKLGGFTPGNLPNIPFPNLPI